MKRKRFNRSAVASSRGNYVRIAHKAWLKEEHKKFTKLEFSIEVPPRYFVKCFGKLMEITEREAMMLKRTVDIITK